MNRIILNENIILLERTMKIKMLFIMAILLSASCINARTLVGIIVSLIMFTLS